jgi:methionyl-tRNA formyltransferase
MTVPIPNQILICGKGRIAALALSFTVHHVATERLASRVVASPNRDDNGHDTWQESLAKTARMLGVDIVPTRAVESDPGLLLISLEYDRIVPVSRFRSNRLYNVHFSWLPKYRGVYTSIWPLLNQEDRVGVSLHVMDPGIDTGSVIDQRSIRIAEHTTSRQLYEHYIDEGLTLFRDWLPRLITTVPAGTPQNDKEATAYDRRSIDFSTLEVVFTDRPEAICAFVRAFSFPEYQRPTVGGRGVRSCAKLSGTTDAAPGSVIHATEYSTSFATGGNGIIEIVWA